MIDLILLMYTQWTVILYLNPVIFIDAALNISLRNFENVMFYHFIYLAKDSEWDQRYDQP